jgi:hypothetical protein
MRLPEAIMWVLVVAILTAGASFCWYTAYHNNLESDRICGQLIQSGNFKSVKECP